MSNSTQRTICRWLHLILSIPIIGYIYSPYEHLPEYAPPTRYIFFPLIVLTGLWMWQGPRVMRLFSKKAA